MPISFDQVNPNQLAPIVAVEFNSDNAQQGPSLLAYRGLIIGQKLPSAAQAANSLALVTSADQVLTLCGRGSMLHRQAQAWFASNNQTEVWIGVLSDDASAAIAVGTLTVSGPATADGTLYLYFGGRRVTVAVTNGDSANTIAANIATAIGKHASGTVTMATPVAGNTVTVGATTFTGATGAVTPGAATFSVDTSNNAAAASLAAQVKAHAVASTVVRAEPSGAVCTLRAVAGGTQGNSIALTSSGSTVGVSGAGTLTGATADTDLPVHASVASAVVTTHAMNAGLVGNECDVRANYNVGEALPAGVGLAIVGPSGGSVNPVLATLISNMGDTWFNILANPYTDATSLTALEAELNSRFGPARMIDGMMFSAKNDTYSNVATLGQARNCRSSTIEPTNSSPTPPEEMSADIAGTVAIYGANDPARPLTTLALSWTQAPALADRYTITERDLLLHDGIGTTRVGAGNVVEIDRLVTTYQTNTAGSPDPSYRDVNTLLTLMYLRYDWRNHVRLKWPRHKLADDGTKFGAGQAVVTPKIAAAEAVAWFEEMEELGLVEDVDTFKTNLVVERNGGDVNRLDFLLPPNLINQLLVVGTQIQFVL